MVHKLIWLHIIVLLYASISQQQPTTSILVLEDDQDVPNSCADIQSEDESLFHSECIDGFNLIIIMMMMMMMMMKVKQLTVRNLMMIITMMRVELYVLKQIMHDDENFLKFFLYVNIHRTQHTKLITQNVSVRV